MRRILENLGTAGKPGPLEPLRKWTQTYSSRSFHWRPTGRPTHYGCVGRNGASTGQSCEPRTTRAWPDTTSAGQDARAARACGGTLPPGQKGEPRTARAWPGTAPAGQNGEPRTPGQLRPQSGSSGTKPRNLMQTERKQWSLAMSSDCRRMVVGWTWDYRFYIYAYLITIGGL